MNRRKFFSSALLALALMAGFGANSQVLAESPGKTETAVFGMGCFWCSQSLFEKFVGVKKIVCGYAGGTTANPTYEEVCSGTTGHAEVVQITFDPSVITYSQLLDIFWEVHDPTTLNAQGADEGTNYRSLILYTTDEQKALAESSKAAAQKKFSSPITTEISPLKVFYPAEDYHQNYFRNHPDQPYCVYTISPKLEKLEKNAGQLPPQIK
jgi:peptide-methionine (S)-S-oxide reductase